MKYKLITLSLVILPLISGCITTTPSHSYGHSFSESYANGNAKKAIELELVNDHLTLTITNKPLSEIELILIRQFILAQGSRYKQRILVSGQTTNVIRHFPQLTKLLTGLGIGQDKQQFKPNGAIEANQLVLTSEYFQAIAPGCHDGLSADMGCANSRNLAMMISDPAQLLRAAPRAPTDANKAVSAIKAYRAGETMQSFSFTDLTKGN